LNEGVEYFQQAIAKDPSYALAYAGLADSHISLADLGFVTPREGYPRAKEAALKALELDDKLAEAHASLANIKARYDWDWSGADKRHRGPRQVEVHRTKPNSHLPSAEA
jgi:tetratricopeptide (TPR) repeat protein